jgi:aldose 1-epimerase
VSDYTATGDQIVLAADGYAATVVSVGAGLRLLSYQGRPLLSGYEADQLPPASRGIVLAPWPNRVGDGHYRFAGTEYQLPITEVARGNAMHGLVFPIEWRIVEQAESSVLLALRLQPTRGYPFRLDLQIAYAVAADGLRITLETTNTGVTDAPYGCGAHPYLTAGTAKVDDTVLQFAADERLEVDERMLPVDRVPVAGTPYDFSAAHAVGDLVLDTAFTGLTYDDDGIGRATLTDPDTGSGVQLWWDATHRWVQLYTADRPDPAQNRVALAVEPMTCPPDAFRSGDDLITLAPGETHRSSWGITATGSI